MGEVLDAWWDRVSGEEEFRMPHQRGPSDPWVHEDGECAWWWLELVRAMARGDFEGGEGEEEGRVVV